MFKSIIPTFMQYSDTVKMIKTKILDKYKTASDDISDLKLSEAYAIIRNKGSVHYTFSKKINENLSRNIFSDKTMRQSDMDKKYPKFYNSVKEARLDFNNRILPDITLEGYTAQETIILPNYSYVAIPFMQVKRNKRVIFLHCYKNNFKPTYYPDWIIADVIDPEQIYFNHELAIPLNTFDTFVENFLKEE